MNLGKGCLLKGRRRENDVQLLLMTAEGEKHSRCFLREQKCLQFSKISKLHELRAALVERDAVDDHDGEV